MLAQGHDVALVAVGEVTGSREDLDDANHAEHEEHGPDDFVALEEVAYLLVHGSMLLLLKS
jgi:hypothetical protein